MNRRECAFLLALAIGLAMVAMVGCGNNQTPSTTQPVTNVTTGTLVTFGTDQPSCDVESFMVTIQSASLVPQGGGAAVTITPPSQPVDFASLVDFTNILTFGSVNTGMYSQLTLTLTSPELTYLNTSDSPPQPVTLPTCSSTVTTNCTSFSDGTATDTLNLMFSPPLTINTTGAAGLVMDFDMRDSVQTGSNGLITGVVDPQITITPSVASGTTLGEADTLYGVVQSAPTTTSSDPSFVGNFPLQVQGGVGQTLTIQVTSTTTFEGDGVTGLSGTAALQALAQGTFVEVDAIVDTSGNIIAQEVDAEAQVVTTGQHAGLMGKVISVTRDTSGNATGFNLLVGREDWDMTSEVPLHSSLAVTLSDTTNYWSNWHQWNRHSLQFGPQSLGLAEDVAVFGVLTAGTAGPPATPATLAANVVFLRQRNVMGTFQKLLTSGSDNKTGGFTMLPCGPLFGGQSITVLTFGDSRYRKLSGLSGLTTGPVINVSGLLYYEQQDGPAKQPTWTAPTWVMEAKTIHLLPQ
jgi:hypothetical protein